MSSIGFIGYGNMASAILEGLLSKGYSEERCWVSNRSVDKLDALKSNFPLIHITKENQEVVQHVDIVILAVKPNQLKDVAEEIKNHLTEKQIIISLAVGVTIEQLESWLGTNKKIIRMMPNTPALVGEGVFSITGNTNIREGDGVAVESLFSPIGFVTNVEEAQIDAIVGVSGSSPAYVYLFIEALADGAVLLGLSRKEAYQLAAQTVLGAAKMVLETGKHPGELKDEVCSPGGTTIEAIASLEKSGFHSSVIEAMRASFNKATDMNQKKK